jgi:hypothetical protein
VLAVLPPMPSDLQAILDKIIPFMQSSQIKMVAIKDENEFVQAKEQFIKDVQAMGVDKVVQWYQTEVDKIVSESK